MDEEEGGGMFSSPLVVVAVPLSRDLQRIAHNEEPPSLDVPVLQRIEEVVNANSVGSRSRCNERSSAPTNSGPFAEWRGVGLRKFAVPVAARILLRSADERVPRRHRSVAPVDIPMRRSAFCMPQMEVVVLAVSDYKIQRTVVPNVVIPPQVPCFLWSGTRSNRRTCLAEVARTWREERN